MYYKHIYIYTLVYMLIILYAYIHVLATIYACNIILFFYILI
nr:MAG TPA: hypothetical protein [Caudoviricetes sp.]